MASKAWNIEISALGAAGASGLNSEDLEWSLRLMERFANSVFQPSLGDTVQFFRALAKVAHEVFAPSLVRIWDNNSYTKSLVLLSSYPKDVASEIDCISRDESLTGLAIQRCEVVRISDIRTGHENRSLQNRALYDIGMRHLVCIPVFNAINTQLVSFVVDLFYDESVSISFFGEKGPFRNFRTISWLTSALGRSLDYLLFRVSDEIARAVEQASRSAAGFAGLFDLVVPNLKMLSRSDGAAVFRVDRQLGQLVPERVEESGTIATGQMEELNRLLFESCVHEHEQRILMGDSLKALPSYRSLVAIPLVASTGEANGVLVGYRRNNEKLPHSFSSLDVHIFGAYARAIGPALERFIRVRESAFLMSMAETVAVSVAGANDRDLILQRTLEAVTQGMSANLGSIYLIEGGAGSTQRLVLKAATSGLRRMVGRAIYELNEGITGWIAGGHTVNFKSWNECRSHPRWSGKYDREVWPNDQDRISNTLLGVPIVLGKKILGVWKLENVQASSKHKDSYFTDEDTQTLRVISAFLAYMIEYTTYKETVTEEFMQLGQASIDLGNARTEDDAILSVLAAVEKSGFEKPRLWLYDDTTAKVSLPAFLASGSTDPSHSEQMGQVLAESVPTTVRRGSGSFYCLPLRLEREPIGILEIALAEQASFGDDQCLLLKAFANNLSISISRLRNLKQVLALTRDVMSSSRFVVAETLSSMGVHSLRHLLGKIVSDLEVELKRPHIRERKELYEPLTAWQKRFLDGLADLNNALQIVKAEGASIEPDGIDAHFLINEAISLWYSYLRQHKCDIKTELDAGISKCQISAPALKEILSVLTVNSVQAHAKAIKIKTFNERDVHMPTTNFIEMAVVVDFSDDGDGLSTQDTEQIFSAEYSTKGNKVGTGLGLFVAKRLARNAGGDLVVLPDKRLRGVTFRLSIPAVA